MSQENVEVLYQAYEAIRRRDVEAFVREMHPDVEGIAYVMSADEEVFRGHAGMRRFLEEILTVFPDWAPEVTDVSVHGDMLLAALRVSVHGVRSGVPVEGTFWQVSRFRDGKAIFWRGFGTRSEALEAMGLRE